MDHTFETKGGHEITLTFENTMFHDIRFRLMAAKFADDARPDANIRSDFCWFASRITNVDGIEWLPPDENSTEKQFDERYRSFTKLIVDETFYDCVRAVNTLKTRHDPVEKPDDQLTKDEQSDPN